MPILITGAAGFVGSHLAEWLHEMTDESIVGLDNFNDYYDVSLKRANALTLDQLARFQMIEGDFCDAALCKDLFASYRFDRVIHLGAYAGVRFSVQHPSIYQEANVGGTLNLLEAARQYPVRRFVLISSSTVYGKHTPVPFREDDGLGVPASPYGVTKRAAELMGQTYHQLHNVPVVCLRPFNVYGPRLRPDLALSIFAAAIMNGTPLTLYGDGSVQRDFTHVSDICQGISAATFNPDVEGETINIGRGQPIQMGYVIQLIEQAMGRTAIILRRSARPEDLGVTFADLTKARRLLDYNPRIAAEEGVRQYCQWFVQWQQANCLSSL